MRKIVFLFCLLVISFLFFSKFFLSKEEFNFSYEKICNLEKNEIDTASICVENLVYSTIPIFIFFNINDQLVYIFIYKNKVEISKNIYEITVPFLKNEIYLLGNDDFLLPRYNCLREFLSDIGFKYITQNDDDFNLKKCSPRIVFTYNKDSGGFVVSNDSKKLISLELETKNISFDKECVIGYKVDSNRTCFVQFYKKDSKKILSIDDSFLSMKSQIFINRKEKEGFRRL